MKKGHGFCRHGPEKEKAMGSVLSVCPWLFLVYFILPSSPQRQADRCDLVIKPVAEKGGIRVDLSVH
jgi:hypothetical protein